MALRSRVRRVARPKSSTRRARPVARRSSSRSSGSRSRRTGAARATTIRVVVQSAPAAVVTPAGAVSMDSLKKARF